MLAGVPVADVLADVARVRGARRAAVKAADSYGTNVAELARLLALRGLRLDRAFQQDPGGPCVLKVRRPRCRSWHWCALVDGVVLDPLKSSPAALADYARRSVTFYPVARS